MFKRVLLIVLLTTFLLLNSSCKKTEEKYVQIILTDNRVINIELYPDVCYNTCQNFINLVKSNYYDGVIFHRVIPYFMIQTGGFYLDGRTIVEKDRVPSITGEFSNNGFANNISHKKGVLSMARATDYNSASNQFFICSTDYPSLDGDYAAFGMCSDEASIDVVVDISFVETCYVSNLFANFPVNPITIKTIKLSSKKF